MKRENITVNSHSKFLNLTAKEKYLGKTFYSMKETMFLVSAMGTENGSIRILIGLMSVNSKQGSSVGKAPQRHQAEILMSTLASSGETNSTASANFINRGRGRPTKENLLLHVLMDLASIPVGNSCLQENLKMTNFAEKEKWCTKRIKS